MAKSANAPSKSRVKWFRYVLLALFGLVIYHIVSGPSGALNLLALRKANAREVRALDSLVQRKQDLEVEKIRLQKDSSYIEQVARKELGMAKPGEKVFRYMPAAKTPELAGASLEAKAAESPTVKPADLNKKAR